MTNQTNNTDTNAKRATGWHSAESAALAGLRHLFTGGNAGQIAAFNAIFGSSGKPETLAPMANGADAARQAWLNKNERGTK